MTNQSRIHETTSRQDFDEVMPTPSSTESKQTIPTDELTPVSSGYGKWLLILGMLSVLGFAVMDLVFYVEAHFEQHPVMTSTLVLVTIAFFTLLALWVKREINSYQRLNQVENQQSQLNHIIAQQDRVALVELLKARSPKDHAGLAAQMHKRFWHTVQDHHTVHDLWQLYQQMVLNPLREKAERQITQATLQGSAISLLSPNDLIHTSVLLWRSMKLVNDLAQLYGIRPGFYGNLHLLKLSLMHAVVQQGADMLVEASLKQLSEQLLTLVAEKGAQAATTGFLVRRLGMATLNLLTIQTTKSS